MLVAKALNSRTNSAKIREVDPAFAPLEGSLQVPVGSHDGGCYRYAHNKA
jgi:hypothetical protein